MKWYIGLLLLMIVSGGLSSIAESKKAPLILGDPENNPGYIPNDLPVGQNAQGKDQQQVDARIGQNGGQGNTANLQITYNYGMVPSQFPSAPDTQNNYIPQDTAPVKGTKGLHRELTPDHAVDSLVMGLEAAKSAGKLGGIQNPQVFVDKEADFGTMAWFFDENNLKAAMDAAIANGASTPEEVRALLLSQKWQVSGLVGSDLNSIKYLAILDASMETGPEGFPDHGHVSIISIDSNGWSVVYVMPVWYDGEGAPTPTRNEEYVGKVR